MAQRTSTAKGAQAQGATTRGTTPRSARSATSTGSPGGDGQTHGPRVSTAEAGQGLTDEEMTRQVAGQTSSDLSVASFFEGEHGGARSEVEAAKSHADDQGFDRSESGGKPASGGSRSSRVE